MWPSSAVIDWLTFFRKTWLIAGWSWVHGSVSGSLHGGWDDDCEHTDQWRSHLDGSGHCWRYTCDAYDLCNRWHLWCTYESCCQSCVCIKRRLSICNGTYCAHYLSWTQFLHLLFDQIPSICNNKIISCVLCTIVRMRWSLETLGREVGSSSIHFCDPYCAWTMDASAFKPQVVANVTQKFYQNFCLYRCLSTHSRKCLDPQLQLHFWEVYSMIPKHW